MRVILGVHGSGYISNADGTCWNVRFKPNGQYDRTDRVTGFSLFGIDIPSCKTRDIDRVINGFGGDADPNIFNGWDILQEEGPNRIYLRSRMYGGVWYAFKASGRWTIVPKPDLTEADFETEIVEVVEVIEEEEPGGENQGSGQPSVYGHLTNLDASVPQKIVFVVIIGAVLIGITSVVAKALKTIAE